MGKRTAKKVNGATNFDRPPYEGISAIAWLIGAIVNIVVARTIGHGVAIVGYAAIPMFAISMYQFVLTWKNWAFKARLTSALPPWIPVKSVIRKQKEANETFLGKGFEWEPVHARLMKEISTIAVSSSFQPPPMFRRLMSSLGLISTSYSLEGKHYIHGSGGGEEDIFVSKQSRRSHTLVLGTNGAGKTRLLESLVTQSISRGWIPRSQQAARKEVEIKLEQAKDELFALPGELEGIKPRVSKARLLRRIRAINKKLERMPKLEIGPVFILDPKGDPDLRDRAYATAKLFGREKEFEYFSPTDALYSFRVNPLANYSRLTELANRISALLPSGGESDAFKQFAWRAINVVLEGLDFCDKPINIPNLRNFVESGIEGLLIPCLELHFRRNQSEFKKEFRDWESKVKTTSNRMAGSGLDQENAKYASALATFYVTHIKATHPNTTIDGMIDVTLHDSQHYNKLISNLIPVLVQLTTGEMDRLLSNAHFPGEARPSSSFQAMIDKNSIVYINFESLADSVVGSALGSLFIADLTACAAARHHKGLSEPPVAIYIDEAAEMMNDPFIQALNKGRAAGFELTLASQTIADFEARMGNKSKALQVLSNVNTTIAMRLQDNDSIRMVADKFADTSYEEKTSSKTSTTIAAMEKRGRDFSGSVMKNSQVSDLALVTADMLSSLPAGHFFGHLPGGRKVKGRVLMMKIDESERYRPFEHGKTSAQYPIGDNVVKDGDGSSALEQVELLRLDPNPGKSYEYHTSHLRLPKTDNSMTAAD